jgi:hypothetical protein
MQKEQIGTLFVWVRALEGGVRGWVVPQGCPPQKVYVPSKKKKIPSCLETKHFVHAQRDTHAHLSCWSGL